MRLCDLTQAKGTDDGAIMQLNNEYQSKFPRKNRSEDWNFDQMHME